EATHAFHAITLAFAFERTARAFVGLESTWCGDAGRVELRRAEEKRGCEDDCTHGNLSRARDFGGRPAHPCYRPEAARFQPGILPIGPRFHSSDRRGTGERRIPCDS